MICMEQSCEHVVMQISTSDVSKCAHAQFVVCFAHAHSTNTPTSALGAKLVHESLNVTCAKLYMYCTTMHGIQQTYNCTTTGQVCMCEFFSYIHRPSTSTLPVNWLPWIQQLLTCLARQEGQYILNLLCYVGKAFPQAVYFPLGHSI